MLEIPEGDPTRFYTEAEKAQLSVNLDGLLQHVHAGKELAPFSLQLILAFHRTLFAGVRDHAGKHRRFDFGAEHLTFGPVRSVHRKDVPKQLEELADRTRRRLAVDFAEPLTVGGDVEARISLAAGFHAEFIRIHPFEDGNGRVGRALMSLLLVRLHLRPIPIEVAKQEYYAVLNEFHAGRGLQPLVDLLIRLYPLEP